MIARLFAGRGRPEPSGPAGTRLYAVGDIHGRVDLVRSLTTLVADDARRHRAPRNVVIFLGDYIDRGAQSREVIELLMHEPLAGFEHVHLRGNHEDVMLRFLDDIAVGPSWLAFGGRETLASYGVEAPYPDAPPDELDRARRALARSLPPAHHDFLSRLVFRYDAGDYVFVHAGVRPGVPLDRQVPQDLMWIRDEFLFSGDDFGRIVVHGHSISPVPEVRHNRIGIDTGAYRTNRLTCLVLDGTASSFLQT